MSVFSSHYRENNEQDDHDDYFDNQCHHGNSYSDCDECDAEINEAGGIDKCLNCGRYKSGNQLNKDQVCKLGCRNPNEY